MYKRGSPFGEYLKTLIKEAGMSQTEFYTALGIKKPYFYDMVSGRMNPPPPDVQFRAVEILKLNRRKREKFFDLAADERGDIPADIAKRISEDPKIRTKIRKELNDSTTENK